MQKRRLRQRWQSLMHALNHHIGPGPQGILGKISGKWKILIIRYISVYRIQRFGELQRRLDGITQSTLTKQLRELESDGFISRKIYPQVPPRTEYSLTETGESFVPILLEMQKWSEKNL